MLSECFIASVRAKTNTSTIAKDVGIHLYELHPSPAVKSSFKKSSSPINALAFSSTHIFAAQVEKAVVHVYSRERSNQEALISFPEKIHSLTMVADGLLVLGTAEGRIILWEVCTGRQVSTPASHLQAVSCLAATQMHLISGSDDSNIHVWSLPRLLSLSSNETPEPVRVLSNHRAAVTSLVLGHSSSTTNICVSASKDNTVIVWNYLSGELLRTFLLPSTPLCLALDPGDRAVYVGFEDGSVQMVELMQPDNVVHLLYDARLQTTPVQITLPPWVTPNEAGPSLCMDLNYDGTCLLTGHTSGKIVHWDTGRRTFASEITDLNAPVTNLLMLSPFSTHRLMKAVTIVKPKVGDNNYTLVGHLLGSTKTATFDRAVQSSGFPRELIDDAVARLSAPMAVSSSGDDQVRKENEELWKVIQEQRDLQKKTWEKYSSLTSNNP